MGIHVKEQRKNGTEARGGADDLETLGADDEASDGSRVGGRRKNGRGRYEVGEDGKQRRGLKLTYERADEEIGSFVVHPDTRALIDKVERDVIRGGRPPSYREDPENADNDMPTLVFRHFVDTRYFHTVDGACALLGIVPETARVWMQKYPRFSAAIKTGKKVQETIAASRMAGAIKYPTSLIFTMKNLHNWADKVEQVHRFSLLDQIAKTESEANPVAWDKVDYIEPPMLPSAGNDVQSAPPEQPTENRSDDDEDHAGD